MCATIQIFLVFFYAHLSYSADIADFVTSYGYPLKVYPNVITEDGYIITLHRIPHGRNDLETKVREPVLLVHPLAESAEMYVFLDPEKSLGFLLADRGYDVWMVNIRATSYSRRHLTLDPNRDKEFWNFTLTELSLDITTSIDYVLHITGFEALFYVGHSQGTTLFFILASEHPEYNKKIKLSVVLSPAVFIGGAASPIIQLFVANWESIKLAAEEMGLYDIHPARELAKAYGSIFCSTRYFATLCKTVLMLLAGWNPEQIDSKYMSRIANNILEGMGLYEIIHFLQMARSEQFQKYDYGKTENVIRYGNERPPKFNLSKVVAPVGIYYSENDIFVNVKGVRKLISLLPNIADSYQVNDTYFSHMDFIVASDIVPLLYARVLDLMESYVIK